MKTLNIFFTVLFAFILLGFFYPNIKSRDQDKVGVLVLAHGGDGIWNETVLQTVEPLKKNYAVEVAFGMADPNTIQTGIDKLESKGVNKIVVVPLFISSYSPIIRQTEYLLGLRKELADEPMIMDHSQMTNMSSDMQQENSDEHSINHTEHTTNQGMEEMHHNSEKVELKPLDINAKILLAKALDDNPQVIEIISDRIKELSKSPNNETVILVAHGPNDENDNKNWVKTMENIADKLREKFKGEKSFRNIICTTVRDDAPKEIYEMAKENLRSLVRQASKDGSVIVFPLLLSQGGIEKGIVKRLEGLNYVWNGKVLLPDSNVTKFIRLSVEKAWR